MSGNGAVFLSDHARSQGKKELNMCIPKRLVSFLEGGKGAGNNELPADERPAVESSKLKFSINAESIRFIAYCFFWFMCLFAIAITKFVVAPILLEGPDDGNTCPPFQISYNEDGTVLQDKSQGFDVATNSHLHDAFGFGNICTNWDYTPSRELTAMVYPLFEYSFLLYIILDFLVSAISYKKGYLSKRYWTVAKTVFPCMFVLCAWFRMIFVVEAYSNVQGHTAGFLGLQISLVTVAIMNTAYIIETNTSYNFLGGPKGTRIAAYVYITVDVFICAWKIYLSAFIVFKWGMAGDFGDVYPQWALESAFGGDMKIGQLADIIWMICNAICPLIISWNRSKFERPLMFTIDIDKPMLA